MGGEYSKWVNWKWKKIQYDYKTPNILRIEVSYTKTVQYSTLYYTMEWCFLKKMYISFVNCFCCKCEDFLSIVSDSWCLTTVFNIMFDHEVLWKLNKRVKGRFPGPMKCRNTLSVTQKNMMITNWSA